MIDKELKRLEERIEALRQEDDEYAAFRAELDAVIAKYGMRIRAVEEGELRITNRNGSVFYESHDLIGH